MADGFGKYEVYAVAGSQYCYKDTSVLRNHFNVRDKQLLSKLETDITALKQNELLNQAIQGRFTPSHLCNIHAYLFGDIYPFAGHYRREDIAKGSTRFQGHTCIKTELEKLLASLKEEKYLVGLDRPQLIERAAHYFAELNYIHPFREGNGRAIREFMRQLFLKNGCTVDWSAVPTDVFMDAMIESVYDTAALCGVLNECVIPKQ